MIRPGQTARFRVDAYPTDNFVGQVRQVVPRLRQTGHCGLLAFRGGRVLAALSTAPERTFARHARGEKECQNDENAPVFHGYYEEHMYYPLFIFDGLSGFPLACILSTHASHRAKAVLKRLLKRLRKTYRKAEIVLRALPGSPCRVLYRFCEKRRIHYVIGLITNDRLKEKSASILARAQRLFDQTGQKQRLFGSFTYRAESWSRYRRVIAKAEYRTRERISGSLSPISSVSIPRGSMMGSTCSEAMRRIESKNSNEKSRPIG